MRYPAGLVLRDLRTAKARSATAVNYRPLTPSCLSGGERQRLALARAFLKDAPILLLDEATSSVDVKSEKLIQAALAKLRTNRTSLIIAHRLSTIIEADEIYVLHQGRILAHGTHDALLQSCSYYRELASLAFHGRNET